MIDPVIRRDNIMIDPVIRRDNSLCELNSVYSSKNGIIARFEARVTFLYIPGGRGYGWSKQSRKGWF